MEVSAPILEAAVAAAGFLVAWGTIRARVAAVEKIAERNAERLDTLREVVPVLASRVTTLESEMKRARGNIHRLANLAQAADSDPPETSE